MYHQIVSGVMMLICFSFPVATASAQTKQTSDFETRKEDVLVKRGSKYAGMLETFWNVTWGTEFHPGTSRMLLSDDGPNYEVLATNRRGSEEFDDDDSVLHGTFLEIHRETVTEQHDEQKSVTTHDVVGMIMRPEGAGRPAENAPTFIVGVVAESIFEGQKHSLLFLVTTAVSVDEALIIFGDRDDHFAAQQDNSCGDLASQAYSDCLDMVPNYGPENQAMCLGIARAIGWYCYICGCPTNGL